MGRYRIRMVSQILLLCEIALHLIAPNALKALDISDIPLESVDYGTSPALVFILDNSGSMDSEFMTPQPHGLFSRYYYLFPDDAYFPANDHVYGNGFAIDRSQRRLWQSRWHRYNSLYYSPQVTYSPWPSTDTHRFMPSDLDYPFSSPLFRGNDGVRASMASAFDILGDGPGSVVIANAHYFTHHDSNGNGRWDEDIETVYLVTWIDGDSDGKIDLGGDSGSDGRRYYALRDDGDLLIEPHELTEVVDTTITNQLRPLIMDNRGGFQRYATDREELQNFVNWFTYYRRRIFAATALVAHSIIESAADSIGLYAINDGPRLPAEPITASDAADSHDRHVVRARHSILDALYTMKVDGGSAIRKALDQVGRYFHRGMGSSLGQSPIRDERSGGSCQRAAAILVTDGFMNGHFVGAGNADGNGGPPFADDWHDTLADVAMRYYMQDLDPDLSDALPITDCNPATHQHMSTHVIIPGGPWEVPEIFNKGATKAGICTLQDSVPGVHWPQPHYAPQVELPAVEAAPQHAPPKGITDPRFYDLAHAAVNGRGLFLSGCDPQGLNGILNSSMIQPLRSATAANVSIGGDERSNADQVYRTQYDPVDWSGELMALSFIGNGKSRHLSGDPIWNASTFLDPALDHWDDRRLVTYGGRWRPPRGTPFRYHLLSMDQMASLGSDGVNRSSADRAAESLLDYIRGRHMEGYRRRKSLLGDIVHCVPAVYGDTVFVGANDGMLHAFDARTGRERFGYIPNLVFGHLKALSRAGYAHDHRFYVDGPCTVGEVLADRNLRHAYLVGGLGKGGKGYFCLLIGQRQRAGDHGSTGDYRWLFHVDQLNPESSEESISALVQWEYPGPDSADDGMDNDGDGLLDEMGEYDPDLGYSYSEAYAVNANTPRDTYQPVIIFGNGYDSPSGSAQLYVLDASSGTILRKIDTGMTGDNGLSTPALIDTNLDRKVDYAYAGDLQGNLWKFDLTAETPAQWGVAYGFDIDADGVIDAASGDVPAPLFTAEGQSITGRPDVSVMRSLCATQAPGFMVVFGTGRYLGVSDVSDKHQQSIFGVWDFGDDEDDSEFLGRLVDRSRGLLSSGLMLSRRKVVSQTRLDGYLYRDLSEPSFAYDLVEDDLDGDGFGGNDRPGDQQPNPDVYAGWFLDFPAAPESGKPTGERVTGRVIIRGGKAVIVSYLPLSGNCEPGGESWLYLLKVCDGSLSGDTGEEIIRPIRFQGKINDDPVILKLDSLSAMDTVLFSDTLGRLHQTEFPGEVLGKVYWWQNR